MEQRFHVVICPNGVADGPIVRQIAGVLKQSEYDVRLRLRSRTPKSFLTTADGELAATACRALNPLGLATVLYEEDRLPPAPPFCVRSLGRTGEEFHFVDRHGEVAVVDASAVTLMALCKCVRSSHSLELNPTDTSGATFPMSRLVGNSPQPIIPVRDMEAEFVTLLFRRDPLIPAIELRQNELDYGFLGDTREANSLANHRMVQEGLRKFMTYAEVDERLLEGHGNGEGEAFYNRQMEVDPVVPHATLIHWCKLAEAGEGRHLAVV